MISAFLFAGATIATATATGTLPGQVGGGGGETCPTGVDWKGVGDYCIDQNVWYCLAAGSTTTDMVENCGMSGCSQIDNRCVDTTLMPCKAPPMVSAPVPSPLIVIMGERIIGYLNFHFLEPQGQPLIYSISGLPEGSGLGIGPVTGIVSGTPNEADRRASPLMVSVYASNEYNPAPPGCNELGGRARADFIMVVEKKQLPPQCVAIPMDANAKAAGSFYLRDLSRYFRDPNRVGLRFTLRGSPRGSGLSINARTGIVTGILTPADLNASPLRLVIFGENNVDECSTNLIITVVPPAAVLEPVYRPPTTAPYAYEYSYETGSRPSSSAYASSGSSSSPYSYESSFGSAPSSSASSASSNSGSTPYSYNYNNYYNYDYTYGSAGAQTQTQTASTSTGFNAQSSSTAPSASESSLMGEQCPSPCSQGNGGCQGTCSVQGPECAPPLCRCQLVCGCRFPDILGTDGISCSVNDGWREAEDASANLGPLFLREAIVV
jgi:hypothetical protein